MLLLQFRPLATTVVPVRPSADTSATAPIWLAMAMASGLSSLKDVVPAPQPDRDGVQELRRLHEGVLPVTGCVCLNRPYGKRRSSCCEFRLVY